MLNHKQCRLNIYLLLFLITSTRAHILLVLHTAPESKPQPQNNESAQRQYPHKNP